MAVSLISILASVGLTLIVTKSFLFDRIRIKAKELNSYTGKLLSCPMCFGFWAYAACNVMPDLINLCLISSLASYIIINITPDGD